MAATSSNFKVKFSGYLDSTLLLQQIKQFTGNTYKLKFSANTSEIVKMQTLFSKFGSIAGVAGAKGSKGINSILSASNKVGQSFTDVIGKVAKFGAATATIGLVTTGLKEAVNSVFEFDSALTELKKVSDLNSESLEEYTSKLGELGQEVARTRTEITQAATEFVKMGYSEDDSAELAKVASMFQNVADSELEAGEAADIINSQLKAFNLTANDAESIIDKVNEVSNNFAVSSTDIATALSKTSAAMSVLGNDINQTIGLVTSGTEILTGQASKVARG